MARGSADRFLSGKPGSMRRHAIVYALLSAALFGASTPLAKLLLGEVAPLLLAATLYLGSGVGLLCWLGARRLLGRQPAASLAGNDYPWLAAAIVAGGVMAPVLLVFGLVQTDGATASLLLNLEAVLTAVIAWVAFRENVDRRVFLGMMAIVAGGVLLAWQEAPRAGSLLGPALIAGACLAWALDNNFTRRVSGADAVTIACLKGLIAGTVNMALALQLGAALPSAGALAAAGLVGLVGYGISLVLFIVALRHLGTARTGAYFSVAPFFGAALALAVLGESTTMLFWIAVALMAIGVRLHLTERHQHQHVHEPLEHVHVHVHDEHHQHTHEAWDGREPHAHAHRHGRLAHSHPHYPDLHHRHPH
jgi:drug/metabolite transporter (DMT)-like permease